MRILGDSLARALATGLLLLGSHESKEQRMKEERECVAVREMVE
jgi:hypothetical protein